MVIWLGTQVSQSTLLMGEVPTYQFMWCSCSRVSEQTGNRKTDQGGDKASFINESAKLLESKRYQQKQNRGRIRDQTKQALNSGLLLERQNNVVCDN
ncbi:hypothetical protein Q3G72_005238 [Acer saccharum]|nr:hypothetical protein Q3G72_005238 [Acer saccharum]